MINILMLICSRRNWGLGDIDSLSQLYLSAEASVYVKVCVTQ